jgi:hypothetical protein
MRMRVDLLAAYWFCPREAFGFMNIDASSTQGIKEVLTLTRKSSSSCETCRALRNIFFRRSDESLRANCDFVRHHKIFRATLAPSRVKIEGKRRIYGRRLLVFHAPSFISRSEAAAVTNVAAR